MFGVVVCAAGLGAAPAGRVASGVDGNDLKLCFQFGTANACNALLSEFKGSAEAQNLAVEANGVGVIACSGALGNLAVGKSDGQGALGSHGSRVGVEALASCPHILHHQPPCATLDSQGLAGCVEADAKVLSDAALRPAIAAQTLGALILGFRRPQQYQYRQQQQGEKKSECCGHGWGRNELAAFHCLGLVSVTRSFDCSRGRLLVAGWPGCLRPPHATTIQHLPPWSTLRPRDGGMPSAEPLFEFRAGIPHFACKRQSRLDGVAPPLQAGVDLGEEFGILWSEGTGLIGHGHLRCGW